MTKNGSSSPSKYQKLSTSDEDWDPEDEDTDDEEGGISNVGRGRVRLHAVQKQISSALDDEEEQRKCPRCTHARSVINYTTCVNATCLAGVT